MHIAVFTCFILIIPAVLSKPQGCPCNAQSPLRCKEDCSQPDTKDSDGQHALRQGQDNYFNADNRLKSYFKNPYENHRQSILDLMNANQFGGMVPDMIPNIIPGRGGWGLGGSWG